MALKRKAVNLLDRSHVEVCQVADVNRTDVTAVQPGEGGEGALPGIGAVSEESKSIAQDVGAVEPVRTADRRLMWHGVFLFLIGLVTGTQERRFTNMRMALSAHLDGVMNGTFLIALGANGATLSFRHA
jgi:hypothetical protein